jgi:prenylcysteine oxidase/farnesylcysteine lyase
MKLGVLWGLIGLLYSLPLSLGEHSNVHHDAVHPEAFGYPASQVVFAQGAPKRVAIIGAGASGSAAAFFLRRAARIAEKRAGLEEGELLGDIIVFEKDDRVGGRE